MTLIVVFLYGLDLRYSTRSFVTGDSLGASGEESTKLSFAAKDAGTIRLSRTAENPSFAARRINRRLVIFPSKKPAVNSLNSSSELRLDIGGFLYHPSSRRAQCLF